MELKHYLTKMSILIPFPNSLIITILLLLLYLSRKKWNKWNTITVLNNVHISIEKWKKKVPFFPLPHYQHVTAVFNKKKFRKVPKVPKSQKKDAFLEKQCYIFASESPIGN